MLKIKASTMIPRDRVVGLSFDGVHLKKANGYDQHNDQVLGPFNEATVMLMRGVFRHFKLPVWYRYASRPSKEDMFEIIQKIEDAGFHVVSVTCDSAPVNRTFAANLGVTIETPFFKHPFRKDDKIFWFFDIGSDQLHTTIPVQFSFPNIS